MIKKTLTLLLFFCCSASFAQKGNNTYNKMLADSLGADTYGMKQYILVILKTGSNKTENKKKLDSLFNGHMQNIQRMATAGKLVVAGPIGKNINNYRGIFILNVSTELEAKKLLETDPVVKAGVLDTEVYQWYGSAALPLYLKFHDQVKKSDF